MPFLASHTKEPRTGRLHLVQQSSSMATTLECSVRPGSLPDCTGSRISSPAMAAPETGNPLQPRVEIGWVSGVGRYGGAPAVMVELHSVGKPDQIRFLI